MHFNPEDIRTPYMSLPGFNPSPSGRKPRKFLADGAVPTIKYHQYSKVDTKSAKPAAASDQTPKKPRLSYESLNQKKKQSVSVLLFYIFKNHLFLNHAHRFSPLHAWRVNYTNTFPLFLPDNEISRRYKPENSFL